MTDVLSTAHEWLAYAASIVVLGAALTASRNAKDASEFRPGLYVAAMVLVDIVVTLGIVQYVLWEAWNLRPEVAYLHPALAVAALAAGHFFIGRAKRTQMAVEAHATARRGLLLALVGVLAAIGVASAPPFLPF